MRFILNFKKKWFDITLDKDKVRLDELGQKIQVLLYALVQKPNSSIKWHQYAKMQIAPVGCLHAYVKLAYLFGLSSPCEQTRSDAL